MIKIPQQIPTIPIHNANLNVERTIFLRNPSLIDLEATAPLDSKLKLNGSLVWFYFGMLYHCIYSRGIRINKLK